MALSVQTYCRPVVVWYVYREPTTGRFLAGTLDDPHWVNLESEACAFPFSRVYGPAGLTEVHEWGAINDMPAAFSDDWSKADSFLLAAGKITAAAQERSYVGSHRPLHEGRA